MKISSVLHPVFVGFATAALMTSIGCNAANSPVEKKSEVEGAVAAPTGTAASTAAPPSAEPALATTFQVVDEPTAKDVTKGPVVGTANGHKFEVKSIAIKPNDKGWVLTLSDTPNPTPTNLVSDKEFIKIEFAKGEADLTGKKFSKAMKSGGGYFQILRTSDPSSGTSWNDDNAYYIEFSKWEVKPWDEKNKFAQLAGTASGKVYVAYRSSTKGIKDSGAAGEFTDVPVVYSDRPFWAPKKAK